MNATEWGLTLRAIAITMADSNRTEQIHIVEEVTSRERLTDLARVLRATERGRALLHDRPELCAAHVDYDALRRLPEGTLGRAYADHLDGNNITYELQARPTQYVADDELSYLVRRFRQTHDVWHPLTGLGIQAHEEVLIHAFSWGQLRLPVSALVMVFGSLKHMVLEGRWTTLTRTMREAYDRGRRAAPLLHVRWEELWDQPLASVRARFGIEPITG